LASTGRYKIFINNQLGTQALLRDLRPYLVDIHGQGDQQTLFDPDTHLELLDGYAGLDQLRSEVAAFYARWAGLRRELDGLKEDETQRLQLVDLLRFQIKELERARLAEGEDDQLEEERRRLMNVEKLTALCAESLSLIYEDEDSAIARVRQAARRVEELGEFEPPLAGYVEGLESARAVLEDLGFSLREFAGKLEFSPERLAEIELRLAELSRLKRKYGGSIRSALDHLAHSEERLKRIERADEREEELSADLEKARADYISLARQLHGKRVRAAKEFARAVEGALAEVAVEHGRFEVRVESLPNDTPRDEASLRAYTPRGIDRVEFYFSANIGEPVRPLARIASGGEASRLMLILKTIAGATEFPRTIVFDEIDAGIGGRVAEAVGVKLKRLSETNQVLCVTHQSQIARFADTHLLVRKDVDAGRTQVLVEKLDRRGRVEELARMLTGAEITETARRHARELLKTG
jgi:DNA repair protein RecN (Recombination protein N)